MSVYVVNKVYSSGPWARDEVLLRLLVHSAMLGGVNLQPEPLSIA